MRVGYDEGSMRTVIALLLTLTLALAGAAAGCGSSNSSSSPGASGTTHTTHFAKTKFVLHAGLAFGAFHRYIYKPYKQGKFAGGLFHHKVATIKAALAAAFAYHEIKLALNDARSSKILSKALAPLLAMQTKLGAMATQLRHGQVDPAAILSANSNAAQTGQESAKVGQPINDQPTPSLGG
jgi:hypothetical protein